MSKFSDLPVSVNQPFMAVYAKVLEFLYIFFEVIEKRDSNFLKQEFSFCASFA